jgi:hypothetical protein
MIPSAFSIFLSSKTINYNVDFEPNLHKEFSYTMSADIEGDYEILVKGDLNESVTVTPNEFNNLKIRENKQFKVILQLPEKIETPGLHIITLTVKQKQDTSGKVLEGKSMAATAEAAALVRVKVLYEGKYLMADLNAPDVSVNETADLNVGLQNWGTQDINYAKATIDIYNNNNKTISTIETNEASVSSRGSSSLNGKFNTTGLAQGIYNAVAKVKWDEGELIAKDDFRIGSLNLKLKTYNYTFEKDSIMPFTIGLESGWNKKITGLYFALHVNGQIIQSFTTELAPFESKNLTAYIDTHNFAVRDYTGDLIVFFENQKLKDSVAIQIIEPAKKEEPASVGFSFNSNIIITLLLITMILALILMNVFLYLHLRKREEKK